MLIDKEFIEIPRDEVARLFWADADEHAEAMRLLDRKSTRLNSSHRL